MQHHPQQQQHPHSMFGHSHSSHHAPFGGAGLAQAGGGGRGFFPPQPPQLQQAASAQPHFAAAFQHAPAMQQQQQHQPQHLFQHQSQHQFQSQPSHTPQLPQQQPQFLPFASSAAFAQQPTLTPAAVTSKRGGHFRPSHGADAASQFAAAAAPSAAASSSSHSAAASSLSNAGKAKMRSKRTRDDDVDAADELVDSSDHADPRVHGSGSSVSSGSTFLPFHASARPDVLPPPNKRHHQNSDDTTLPIDSRRSSAELLSDEAAAASLNQQASFSGMDDLLSTVSEDEAVAAASPLSDVDSGDVIDVSTPAAAAAAAGARSSSSSSSSAAASGGRRFVPGDESPTTAILRRLSAGEEVEVDREQWLQVNETFQPLLEKMCSEQAKRAAGFDVPAPQRGSATTESILRDLSAQQQQRNGNVGRAVWDRFQPDPMHNSAFAHAAASASIPAHQSMVLYKPPTRPLAPISAAAAAANARESSCKIECVDDDTPSSPTSPSCICVETPASRASTRAAAAAAAAASSSSSSSSGPSSLPFSSLFPSAQTVRIPADMAHAGWKRRRASEDEQLPLYSSTVQIEDMDDFEAQENKKARRRAAGGAATPTTPAAAAASAASSSAAASSPQTDSMCPATPTPLTPLDSAMMMNESSSLPPSPSPSSLSGIGGLQMQQPELLSLPALAQPASSLAVPAHQPHHRPLVNAASPFGSCPSSSSSASSASFSSSSAHRPLPSCLWNSSAASAAARHPLLQPHTWQPQPMQQQQQQHCHLPLQSHQPHQPHQSQQQHPHLSAAMHGFAAAMANAHRPLQATNLQQPLQQPPLQPQQPQACLWQSVQPQPPAATGPNGSPMLW